MPESFLEEMKQLLSKEDYDAYKKSVVEPPKKAIKLQLEKIDPNFFEKKSLFPFKKIQEVKGGYYVTEEKLGNHPYHHAGLFYIQEPSAMLPPLLVPFQKNFKILDLCAAPGGKTLSLSNQVPEGFVLSNEINYTRAKKLLSNVERLGLKNVLISSMSSKKLQQIYCGYFDVILIDAPCSGEGMFRKDSVAKKNWSKKRIEECSLIGQELLSDSASMLKENGYLIYSTCTFSLLENEQQIINFLKHHSFQIVEISKKFDAITKPGMLIDSNYKTDRAKRCYPYLYGEGQFMIVLKKVEPIFEKNIVNHLQELTQEETKIVNQALEESLVKNDFLIQKYQNNIVVVPHKNLQVPKMTLLSCFVKLGEIVNGRFIFHHQFIKAYGSYFKKQCRLSLGDLRIKKYLKGEEIQSEVEDGFGVIMVDDYPLGLYKAKNNTLKNHYPKGLRYQS